MKNQIIIKILKYLKMCDDAMKFMDEDQLYKAANVSVDKAKWIIKELSDENYIDNQQIKADGQGTLIKSDMHRPMITDRGLELLKELTN